MDVCWRSKMTLTAQGNHVYTLGLSEGNSGLQESASYDAYIAIC